MSNKKPIATLIIKRPSWEGVKEAYKHIYEVGKLAYNECYKKLKLQGFNDYYAEEQANVCSSQARYNLVGGQAKSEFERDSKTYINTCALRVSYAFNYGGMLLNNKKSKVKLTEGTKLVGADENIYYTGVSGIKELLLENWKRLQPYSEENNRDFYKIFYDHKKEPFKTLVDEERNIINRTRVEEIREDNLNFLRILKSLEIKGVVTMIIEGWGNAGGHTTLWKGNDFIDETHYLNDKRDFVFVRELCFWELKEQTKEIQ